MQFLRKFNYSNISQRKMVDYNNLLSFIMLGILFTDAAFLLSHYFFYFPGVKLLGIVGMGGVFLGNMAGRFLYPRRNNYRGVYLFSELAFIAIFILYLSRNILMPADHELMVSLFFLFKYSIPFLFIATSFFFGIKMHYSIRISCGDFIDKKHGIERFIGFMLLGSVIGIMFAGVLVSFDISRIYLVALPLLALPSIFVINLPYNAPQQYAKDYEEEREPVPEDETGSDSVFFTYLNFLYIAVYSYLGYVGITRYYGDLLYLKCIFLVLLFIIILCGFAIGRLVRKPVLNVYGEVALPAGFMLFLILIFSLNERLGMIAGILLFSPMALLMGVLLYHTVRAIIAKYDNIRRSTLIEFSLLIVPVPVLITMSIINFTNILYVVMSGIVMAVNLLIPAVYISNRPVRGYKKIIFYAAVFLFLPAFIFIVLNFKIPINSDAFVKRVGNFDELMNVNFNADYISNRSTITMSGIPVFELSDSVVRNLKRSLVPVALYHPEDRDIIFIDGNQRFFRNPVIGYFENSVCLDLMSERDVDFRKLPYSGMQKYVPENHPLLFYMDARRSRYHTIVDIPNLMDQRVNSFRFSIEYYRFMKKRLKEGGIFVQVYNVPGCGPELFTRAVKGLRASFSYHAIYYFSNLLVIFSSDDEKTLAIDTGAYDRLIRFFNSRMELSGLFYNEAHILSHLSFKSLDDLPASLSGGRYRPGLIFMEPKDMEMDRQSIERHVANNDIAFEYLARLPAMLPFNRFFMETIRANDSILSLLKKTEMAEAREDYIEETSLLFDLKRQAEYRAPLQRYVFAMLEYKEKYFYSAAMRLEKERKWEGAQGLYKAVLAINPDHFNANYRMGLLSLTLQDIEGSFFYLQQAMRIQKDDPRALYQMGVLHYSTGGFAKAIEYFIQSLQKNEKIPGIDRYLGLCHENLGNLYEAEKYFARAIIADPNDIDTKSRLEEIRSLIEKEKKKWETPEQKNEFEVEQNADMPLPVSRGAYEMRLKDDDKTLPVADPSDGGGEQAPNP